MTVTTYLIVGIVVAFLLGMLVVIHAAKKSLDNNDEAYAAGYDRGVREGIFIQRVRENLPEMLEELKNKLDAAEGSIDFEMIKKSDRFGGHLHPGQYNYEKIEDEDE